MTFAFFVAFFVGLLSTLIAGVLARFTARFFVSHETGRISAFAIALGFALGRFSYSGPLGVEAALAVTTLLGATAALVALWVWLFRKAGGKLTDEGVSD